ncbi:MAG: hypothetical protein ACI33N_03970 [Desulfovibrionaceae bacterium]
MGNLLELWLIELFLGMRKKTLGSIGCFGVKNKRFSSSPAGLSLSPSPVTVFTLTIRARYFMKTTFR